MNHCFARRLVDPMATQCLASLVLRLVLAALTASAAACANRTASTARLGDVEGPTVGPVCVPGVEVEIVEVRSEADAPWAAGAVMVNWDWLDAAERGAEATSVALARISNQTTQPMYVRLSETGFVTEVAAHVWDTGTWYDDGRAVMLGGAEVEVRGGEAREAWVPFLATRGVVSVSFPVRRSGESTLVQVSSRPVDRRGN